MIPLSRFRAALARPRGTRRADALLEGPDPAAAVAALTVPDFYFLVREVGLDESTDLMALATPEQVRGCLDLEIWDRDRLDATAMEPWLAALMQVGHEKVTEVWAGLDPEVRALFLARTEEILDHSLEEAPRDDDDRPMFTTPDSFFTIVLTSESDEERQLVYLLLDNLYRSDMELAQHTIMAARSEMESQLEEMSYRWRSGRMADLGYVDFYEALEVFRPLEPESVRYDEGTADRARGADVGDRSAGLPVPIAEPMSGTFLARALEQVTDAALAERLEASILHLVNRVLSASRVKPGDEEAVRAASLHAAATVSLGLEHLAAGRIDRAPEVLESVAMVRIHRLGHTLTLRLGRMARLLVPRAITAGEPSQSVLEALLRARPLYAGALDDPRGDRARPFASLAELRRAAQHLTDLAARIALADALGVDLVAMAQAPEPRPELDDHVRTALARLLGAADEAALDAAPLAPAELERARDALARLDADGRVRALKALLDLAAREDIAVTPELMSRLATRWLDQLADELGALKGPIDARGIGGVITSAGKE